MWIQKNKQTRFPVPLTLWSCQISLPHSIAPHPLSFLYMKCKQKKTIK